MKSPGQWTMKTFPLSSIVLLAFFLSVHLGAATDGSEATLHSIQQPCCLNFNHKMLPWNWVYSYELAKDSCLQKVVIFTTKRGQKVCVQPQAKWVQRYISLLNAQKHL
nr:C-C motif chemokine 26 isoform X2 [Myodes glareolus]